MKDAHDSKGLASILRARGDHAQAEELENIARQLVVDANSQLDLGATASLLAETDRDRVLEDAASDGSSYICEACGGLVSMKRKEAHMKYWCGPCVSD